MNKCSVVLNNTGAPKGATYFQTGGPGCFFKLGDLVCRALHKLMVCVEAAHVKLHAVSQLQQYERMVAPASSISMQSSF